MSQQNTVFWLVLVWFNSEAISPRWGSPRLVSPWSLRDAWPPGARSWGPPPPLRCHYGTFLEKMKINRLNNLTGEVRMVSNISALWQLFKFTEISTVILFNLPATKVNTRQLMVQHPLCDLFHPFKYSSLQPHANCSRDTHFSPVTSLPRFSKVLFFAVSCYFGHVTLVILLPVLSLCYDCLLCPHWLHLIILDPALWNEIHISTVFFFYLDSFTLTSVIRINGHMNMAS